MVSRIPFIDCCLSSMHSFFISALLFKMAAQLYHMSSASCTPTPSPNTMVFMLKTPCNLLLVCFCPEKTDGGNLTINTEDCKLDFHHLKLIFPEIDNFMLRFLTDILSIPLRMQIHRLVCEKLINVSEEVEMELQQHIGLLPIWDYAALDTTLTSDPLVSSSFLQTQHSGALHVFGEAESDSKSFNSTPNALSIAVNPPRMMYIWVQRNVLEKIIQTFVTKELQRRHNWSSVKNTFQRTNFSRPFLRMMKKLFVQKGAASPVFDIRFPQLPLIYFVDEKFFVKGKAMGTIWRIGQPRRGRGDIGFKELNKAEQLSTFSIALTMEIFTDYKDGEITVTGVMQRLKVRLGKKSVLSTKDRARFLKVLKKFSRSGGFHTLLQSLEKDLGRMMQRQMKNLNLLSPSFYTREGNFCLETDFVVRKEFLSHVVKKLLEKHQLSSPAVSQTPTPFLNTTFS
uniref:Uncharacterized protein n=1 Tax=Eptatretus burgeri TaxID=7764 RepID=A0A8C4QFN2_EPTBU